MKKENTTNKSLSVTTQVRVRFNETDPLGIVWHGHYITYFEEGREAFGKQYGISYLDIYSHNFTVPIIKFTCEHKRSLRYGDIAHIETFFVPTQAAKMIFNYIIYNDKKEIVCTGETIQAFVDKEGNLSLNNPDFFEEWKTKMKV